MINRTPKEKAKAREFAREVYEEVFKIERYIDFYVQNPLSLSPSTQKQMRRAKEAVYGLRVFLHCEKCKY